MTFRSLFKPSPEAQVAKETAKDKKEEKKAKDEKKKTEKLAKKMEKEAQKPEKQRLQAEYIHQALIKFGFENPVIRNEDLPEDEQPLLEKSFKRI